MNNNETNELLKEILKWQKLQGIQIARELIPKILDTKEKKIVYELTNGKNGIKEIQAKIKIATGTVHKWWNSWLSQGIVIKEGKKYRKLISLKELDFKSSLEKNKKESEINNES